MKKSAIVAACAVLGLVSCEGDVKAGDLIDNAKGALEKVEDIDLSALSPEKLKETASGLVDDVASKLAEIKDQASAENLSKTLGPALEKLSSLKGRLADAMPDLSALKSAADKLASQFESDSAIMKALKPLLDKINSLLE